MMDEDYDPNEDHDFTHWLEGMPGGTNVKVACGRFDLPDGCRLHVTVEMAHPDYWYPPVHAHRPIVLVLTETAEGLIRQHLRDRGEAEVEGTP